MAMAWDQTAGRKPYGALRAFDFAALRKMPSGSMSRLAQALRTLRSTRLKTQGCLYNTGPVFTTPGCRARTWLNGAKSLNGLDCRKPQEHLARALATLLEQFDLQFLVHQKLEVVHLVFNAERVV